MIYFLNYYEILFKNGNRIIDNNTLTALTLLIAQSNPKEKDILIKTLKQFTDKELLEVFAFYYYGRDIVGRVENSWYSYFDQLEDLKDTSRANILDKLCGVQKNNLYSSFKKAFENFDEHERNILKEKEKHERRQKSFLKKDGKKFFEREEDFEKSNSINIQKIFNRKKKKESFVLLH